MKVYFSHPVTDYGTTRQEKALAALKRYWGETHPGHTLEIVTPDFPEHQAGYAAEGMEYFKALVENCWMLAFMRFPDGGIGAGVGQEIKWAMNRRMLVVEIFDGRLYDCASQPGPILTVEETRAKIASLSASPSPVDSRDALIERLVKAWKALPFAGSELIQIVEGLRGTMEHGTWRDDHGVRLKDTNEWVLFYTTFKSALAAAKEQQP